MQQRYPGVYNIIYNVKIIEYLLFMSNYSGSAL